MCLLGAEDGWPVEEDKAEQLSHILKPNILTTLAGSHHFDADPATAFAVAEEVIKCLQE